MDRQPIIPPVDADLIASELTPSLLMRYTNRSNNEIYTFKAAQAPHVMLELGRLREEAFSAYGGGTGREVDIDSFDTDPDGYSQLIVWDPQAREILGGYRYIHGADVHTPPQGKPSLATGEMFDFHPDFITHYLPYTIELGRSFVSLPYQSTHKGSKAIFVLDNLWDGVGALSVVYPNVKYFYGKVTMYRNYNREARNLILYFLHKHFPDEHGLVSPIHPLPIEVDEARMHTLFPTMNYQENYRTLNRIIRAMGINIPPLINSYMNLSPEMKVFGTAINDDFGQVEETGIFLAVDKILEEKKKRHIDTFAKPTLAAFANGSAQ